MEKTFNVDSLFSSATTEQLLDTALTFAALKSFSWLERCQGMTTEEFKAYMHYAPSPKWMSENTAKLKTEQIEEHLEHFITVKSAQQILDDGDYYGFLSRMLDMALKIKDDGKAKRDIVKLKAFEKGMQVLEHIVQVFHSDEKRYAEEINVTNKAMEAVHNAFSRIEA
jgi:ribosomal protein S8